MLERLRQYFILDDSHLKLYLLATLTGLLAGGVIVCFRLFIDYGQVLLLPSKTIETFASLSWYWLLSLPIIGGLIVGLLFTGIKPDQKSVGVVHVIERLSYHEGRLPWKNFIRQFLGAGIALISGHSVGREGPSVHLGAASGSFFGMSLDLPNNGIRVLVASGSAAAIAASFNTPVAGVIFAMEVIMMEYHITTFIPLILASVSGAVMTRLVFGDAPIFGVLSIEIHSLWELPYIILLGVLLGLLAVLFIRSLHFFTDLWPKLPLWLKTSFAGLLVGLGGLIMPDVMGMSYNITNIANLSELALSSLFILLFLKLFLSTACIGLGIPGGLIGPTIVIGAVAGAALGLIGNNIFPEISSSIGLYALIGMGAMMGATLNAPLAALMALLELTANPHIILPGMLAIVFANIIVFERFKLDSIFLTLLRARGLDYRNDPVSQALRRVSVANAMQREFTLLPETVSYQQAKQALSNNPLWIILQQDQAPVSLMPAADLARALEESDDDEIDLFNIPASRLNLTKASLHDSLQEALDLLNTHHAEALYITRITAPTIERTYGILTRQDIESHYQSPRR
jgi:H+/Cl- antiporter ClcA